MVSRRIFLGGALASVGSVAYGAPPEVSLRPMLRPGGFFRRAIPAAADLVAAADLGGRVGFAVADARTGQMLEVFNPLRALPPASVMKAITSAYALDRLGPGYRFRTRIMADGPITNGRLDGDLWLVGSGDPVFDTDALQAMTAAMQATGLREVTGQLRLAAGALPYVAAIDPEQPSHVGYNPAVSGLNLNFNRVHFEWLRVGDGYTVRMDARSATLRPPVSMARMRIADRDLPVYTYAASDAREDWTVARTALGDAGSRWLPVRHPHLYMAEVFQVLARSHGIVLDGPVEGTMPPEGAVTVVEHASEPLADILRGMMLWSTNLTAEVMGLAATQAGGVRPDDLPASAAEMGAWMAARWGARNVDLIDHSGLGGQSRVRPQDMVQGLVSAGTTGMLRRLMKDIPMRDADGNLLPDHPVQVVAKTGTLNFVSTLAGYARTGSGRDLAFAVFCADIDRRDSLSEAEMESPDGGRAYSRRARRLQQLLIERWGNLYDAA